MHRSTAFVVGLVITLAAVSARAEGDAYRYVDITDLKLDIKTMLGQRVSTKALLQTMGDVTFLKSDPMDMTALWASVDALPREDRKKIVSGCQMLLCGGKFYGVVTRGTFGPTVKVEKVEWN